MMPERTLLLLAAVLVGVITGIYLCGWIHDHRVADLSAREYVAMHQMRDRTFRRIMPVLAIGTIVLVVAAAFSASAGTSRGLAIVAATLLCIDAVWTVRRQVPLNKLIQSWTSPAFRTTGARCATDGCGNTICARGSRAAPVLAWSSRRRTGSRTAGNRQERDRDRKRTSAGTSRDARPVMRPD